jgi:hypothetical protein
MKVSLIHELIAIVNDHPSMITEEEILYALDNYRNGYDPAFVELGHPYVYPIDSRINVFRKSQDNWALAIETLGYNPRGNNINLDITYYGNCLINLEKRENYISNSYCIWPIELESFNSTIETECLKPDAKFWNVRNKQIELSHIKQDYLNAGIDLKEYEPNEISAEKVGRFLVIKHRDLFRATNDELYKSIPKDLNKILVIDEWHHRDFYQNDSDPVESLPFPIPTLEQLKEAFGELNEISLRELNISKEVLLKSLDFTEHNEKRIDNNKEEWENNRPSSYETWQLIAKVLVTGDTSQYKPTLEPTSHWKNWPDAGTM